MDSSNKMYIAFEGIDRSGKTTQSKMFYEFLKSNGYNVFYTYEPGATKIGTKIRDLILNNHMDERALLFLFLADRVLNVNIIKKYMEQGFYIVSDRSLYSTIAYQHYGNLIDINIIQSCHKLAVGKYVPNVVFYIDIPIEIMLQRIKKKDAIESKDTKFYKRVKAGYLSIARQNNHFFTIDGNKDVRNVFEDIVKIWKNL